MDWTIASIRFWSIKLLVAGHKHPAGFFSCILQQPEIYPVKGRDKLKLLVMGFLEGLAYDFSFLKDVKRNFVVS